VIYIGIDPGAQGGLVALDGDIRVLAFSVMPKREDAIWGWISLQGKIGKAQEGSSYGTVAVIEQVGGYVGEAQPGSAMFNFGWSYGGLRMALVAADISFEAVVPRVWQSALGILPRKKSEGKTEWKKRLRSEAAKRYPRVVVTASVADALLIAAYCKMTREAKDGED
jgi:hypothetical protein